MLTKLSLSIAAVTNGIEVLVAKFIAALSFISENNFGRLRSETGATTAEYAITVLAACAFAALLFAILGSGEMRTILFAILTRALNVAN